MMTSFAGIVRKEREVGRFRLVETEYAGGARIDWHAHPHPYVYLVLAGAFREHRSHGSAQCSEGWVTYRAAGEPHATVFGRTGARCLMVELPSRSDGLSCLADLPPNVTLPPQGSDLLACGTRLFREFNTGDDASTLAAEGLVLAMLAYLSRAVNRAERTAPLWLTKVEAVLRDAHMPPPDRGELSRIAGVSGAHLSRVFLKHHRCSIGEFVRGLRVADAERALQSTERTISEIAHTTGFCDQSHFTREFRRRNGVTPATYRRMHRQPPSLAS